MLTSKQVIRYNFSFKPWKIDNLCIFLRESKNKVVLVILSGITCNTIQYCVFCNKNFPLKYAKILARDGNENTRFNLSGYTNHEEVLKILLQDEDYTVRRMANDQLNFIKETKTC